MNTRQTAAAKTATRERQTMTTKLDKLLEQKRAIESRILKLKNADREERKARALRVLEASGLLELEEEKLISILSATAKTVYPAAAKEQRQ